MKGAAERIRERINASLGGILTTSGITEVTGRQLTTDFGTSRLLEEAAAQP